MGLAWNHDCQHWKKGLRYFQAAARHGDSKAQLILGEALRIGFGIPANKRLATAWLTIASQSMDRETKEIAIERLKDKSQTNRGLIDALRNGSGPLGDLDFNPSENFPSRCDPT